MNSRSLHLACVFSLIAGVSIAGTCCSGPDIGARALCELLLDNVRECQMEELSFSELVDTFFCQHVPSLSPVCEDVFSCLNVNLVCREGVPDVNVEACGGEAAIEACLGA